MVLGNVAKSLTSETRVKTTPIVHSYRDLRVWQHGMDLVVHSYQATKRFPDDERYGLTSQIRRSAVSIPSNIAEGHGRSHTGQYTEHVSIANGSLKELETQVLIAGRLGFLSRDVEADLLERTEDLGRMLRGSPSKAEKQTMK